MTYINDAVVGTFVHCVSLLIGILYFLRATGLLHLTYFNTNHIVQLIYTFLIIRY